MGYEISRQLVHLSGLVFVLLAQFTGGFAVSLIFFIIALVLFLYSEYVGRGKGFLRFMGRVEKRVRHVAFKLDRDGIKRPFMGAFWFYFALGLTFLIFPLEIATASGLILSIGDSLSTIVGLRYGEHKIFGRKSIEGSLVFFLSSFLITAALLGYVLVGVHPALVSLTAFLGSISATFIELIPEAEKIRNWKNKEIVDDNWLIPLFSGLVIYIAYILTGIV
jgi:dolichol kinase